MPKHPHRQPEEPAPRYHPNRQRRQRHASQSIDQRNLSDAERARLLQAYVDDVRAIAQLVRDKIDQLATEATSRVGAAVDQESEQQRRRINGRKSFLDGKVTLWQEAMLATDSRQRFFASRKISVNLTTMRENIDRMTLFGDFEWVCTRSGAGVNALTCGHW